MPPVPPLPMPPAREAAGGHTIGLIARTPHSALACAVAQIARDAFEVVAFESAVEARARLGELDALIVALDPAMDGACAQTVASAMLGARVPVVVVADTAEHYLDLVETGADPDGYVLAAGLTDGVLRRCVRAALARASARAHVRASEARYRRLYDDSVVPVYELDLEGRLVAANPAMVELFEYATEAEMLEANARGGHFVNADDRREWFSLLRRKQKLVKYRKSMRTRTGRRRELLDTTYLVHDTDGLPIGYQGSVVDYTEVHELGARLEYEANHDSLTGLPNRRSFEDALEEAIEGTQTQGTMHALCYFDLDQFKVVNDTFGHAAGDELLQELGGDLMARISSHDTLARVGGDEFALLLRDRSIEQSAEIASALLDAIRAFRFRRGDNEIDVGASIGVVPIDANTTSLSDLLSAADAACYTAKEKGRNRVHVQEADDKTVNRRIGEMRLVFEAKQALQENRMRLYHQPIRALPLAPGDQMRFEILIRMLGWDGDLVPPGVFLPAIEKYHLSKSVDCWVLDRFLAWLANAPRTAEQLAFGSINVSGLSLGDPDFLSYICAQLDMLEISGDKLCFEITETAAVQNVSAAQNFIATLRTRGCRFALDDFGSGTSSFGYLKNLPVDSVKIDGMFVRTLRQDRADRAIVKSVNEVAHSLGLRTTAEFVEDAETLAIVTELGVDFAQGFAVGLPQPLPLPDLPALPAARAVSR